MSGAGSVNLPGPEYNAVEDYGIIGDMHTCALIDKGGSLDFMCWPVFDSPSVFCRLLDANKGGHWGIAPAPGVLNPLSKQRYLPYSNLLETRWTNADGGNNASRLFCRIHQTNSAVWSHPDRILPLQ